MAEENFVPVGPGIERLAEECELLFPDARTVVLSSDSVENELQLVEKIKDIASGYIDIIIGTQIISKGHNFERITLVGVIDADVAIQGTDIRAAEKSFQSLLQVSGRAGRKKKKGEALLQTRYPENPVISAIVDGDEEKFWEAECESRQAAGVPPYGRMVSILISGPNEAELMEFGRLLVLKWNSMIDQKMVIFGPALAPIAKVRSRYRVRLLIKAKLNENTMQTTMQKWLNLFVLPKKIRMLIDVDPQSFY